MCNNFEIKYLLKFVPKRSYADDLINGTLYTRPAAYYHALETGQGDMGEAALSHEICMYKHSTVPIYCMYAILGSDITNGKVHISRRCINDFECENGYIVKIDYSSFESRLRTVNSGGYQVSAGLVNYHTLTQEDTTFLLTDNTERNLFVERSGFYYQKEFRVVICKQVYQINEHPIDEIRYHFSPSLQGVAQVIAVSSLQQEADDYILLL